MIDQVFQHNNWQTRKDDCNSMEFDSLDFEKVHSKLENYVSFRWEKKEEKRTLHFIQAEGIRRGPQSWETNWASS